MNTPNDKERQMHKEITASQKEVCKRYGVEWEPSRPDHKVGISQEISSGEMPINGLRHPATSDTTGWYIWSGEYSERADFFQPMHTGHLNEYCPLVLKYLGLPAGWRFQIDDKGYEDVWFDEKLLQIED